MLSDSAALSRRELLEQCLARIEDPSGEGGRTFTKVYADAARATADFADRARSLGMDLGPLAGLPLSIKDLFDVAGETTLAGSRVLQTAPPASADALIVRRLRRAGAVIVGKTNMTEFAFSGLGINPHYGTPANPWGRREGRIPGGSSSGAGVSVADGMAIAAIGTDTGGSVRIPAAMCGLVGFKPTARSVPLEGTFPLSPSFDSIGPLAQNVDTCALLYQVLADLDIQPVVPRDASSITLGVVKNYVLEGMDESTARNYEAALKAIRDTGIRLKEISLPVLDKLPDLFVNGGIVAAEAFAHHRNLIESSSTLYDPRVLVRVRRGENHLAADYLHLLRLRGRLIGMYAEELEGFDAIVAPTVPIVPPTLTELADDDAYARTNILILRNPTIVNALDGCAISVPCHAPGDAPAGLMLASIGGRDLSLLATAKTIESLLKRRD
jgi:aspartyl-tRNA(Asn)/glutamyl-tRNA(Gln) amidotransferase subunit A